MAGVKSRRKVSCRNPARLRPSHPTPARFEPEQGKNQNRLSVKLSCAVTALGKGHGSRGEAWASQELSGILISCLTKWTEPPAARPCPCCSRRWLPLFHQHTEALLWAGMKPWRSNQTSWGGGGLQCLLSVSIGCNILRITQYKEYFTPKNVPICIQSVCLYCVL